MRTLEPILREHPFFAGLPDADLKLITGCAKNVRFEPGEVLARQGQPADEFFLLREGRITVGIPAPSGCSLNIETLDAGDIVGWSWLFKPHLWQFDLIAVTPVRALSMDGRCLREKCDADPRLGYDMMKRLSQVMSERLAAARLQLIDLYSSEKRESTDPSRA